LKPGQGVGFCAWQSDQGRRTFHDRYLLTDKPGVVSTYGFDHVDDEVPTILSILNRAFWRECHADFDKNVSGVDQPKGWHLDYAVVIFG
jgi:hypothetical protein